MEEVEDEADEDEAVAFGVADDLADIGMSFLREFGVYR